MEEFFNGLSWKKFSCILENKGKLSNYPYIVVVNSIVKEVSAELFGSFENSPKIVFHIKGRNFNFKLKPSTSVTIEIIFAGKAIDFAGDWHNAFIKYFENPKNSRNNSLLSCTEVEEISYPMLKYCYDFSLLKEEVTLNFLNPLSFTPKRKHSRTFLNNQMFFNLVKKRYDDIFQVDFPEVDLNKFFVNSNYLSYTEIKKPSISQGGSLNYINGCVGNLYIKGDLSEILPYLILGAELHIGNRFGYGYGYYLFHPKSIGFFDHNFSNYNYIESVFIETMDELDDPDVHKEIDKNLPSILQEEIVAGLYSPLPVETFTIPKNNGEKRIIEKPTFRDLVVQKMLYKMLYKPLESSFEYESIGFRKGLGRDDAIARINFAISKGYSYIIESDVEDFFPSVDHEILMSIVKRIIPESDIITLGLLEKFIKTKYVENGNVKIRERGLSLGMPLSPLLSNLYLDAFDEAVKQYDVILIRYADDFIIFTKDEESAYSLLEFAENSLGEIKLGLNKAKTSVKHISQGFNFLGYNFSGDGSVSEISTTPNPFRKPLFITEPYVFVGVSGGRIEVRKDKNVLASVPINRVSDVLLLERGAISTQCIKNCIDNNIPISFTLNSGYYITTIKPDSRAYYDMSSKHGHYYYKLSEAERLSVAIEFVNAKIKNNLTFLKKRRYSEKRVFLELETILSKLQEASSLDELRGLEGKAARIFFGVLNELILVPEFKSVRRGRKEPDRLNALLNYGYYLLFSRINALVRAQGLNPYLGFLHSDINNYESLVADIQEPFRIFVDRLILRLVNNKSLVADDFVQSDNGRFYFTGEGRKKFLNFYELEFTNTTTFGESSIYDMVYVQVLNIKKWLNEGSSIAVIRW